MRAIVATAATRLQKKPGAGVRPQSRLRATRAAPAALMLLLCALATVRAAEPASPDRGGPDTGKALLHWEEAKDWDITYRCSNRLEGLPYGVATLRVRYLRPNQVRLDVTDSEEPYIALAGADSVRMYLPQHRLLLWAPLNEYAPFEPGLLPTDLRFRRGPLPGELSGGGPQMVSAQVIAAARRGIEGERLLPEDSVAGRPALVIERTRAAGREVTWVDKEYGFPLAGRTESEGRLQAEFRAQDVRINTGLDPAGLAIEVPSGVVTLRGRFGLEDAETIRHALSGSLSDRRGRIPSVGLGDPMPALRYVLTLPRVPLGFRGLGHHSMRGTDVWAATRRYVSPTGATISFTQRVDVARVSLLEVTGGLTGLTEATPAEVGGRPATLYRHQEPYPGAILVWDQQGVRAVLETTQIAQEQLLSMAGSVMPLEVTLENELLLPDLNTAASLLAMPVYRPNDLPSGAKLLRLTVMDTGGLEPLHLVARYRLPGGVPLTIAQRGTSGFLEAVEPPGGQSASVPGGEAVYYPSPYLIWRPEASGSIVIISGHLGKADMLKIARSLEAVAPPQ